MSARMQKITKGKEVFQTSLFTLSKRMALLSGKVEPAQCSSLREGGCRRDKKLAGRFLYNLVIRTSVDHMCVCGPGRPKSMHRR